jgi:uncharacterized protein involved in cysteine biosynthesis
MDVMDLNTPVNYITAISPYLPYLCREAALVEDIPRSICVANKRLGVSIENNIMELMLLVLVCSLQLW